MVEGRKKLLIPGNRLKAGWELHKQGDLDAAEEYYQGVIDDYPGNAAAWCYLGMVLNDKCDFHRAQTAYTKALKLKPEMLEALTNLGNTLANIGQHEEAIKVNLKALEINPDYARAHVNLGIIYLRSGNLEQGWNEYEWRIKTGMIVPPNLDVPYWDGGTLDNRDIIIHGEQGMGDELQFVRFAYNLKELGARKIYVTCQTPLIPLFQNIDVIDRAMPRICRYPEVDYQVFMMSLPRLLHINKNIPTEKIPYLSASEKKTYFWKHILSITDKYKVGIVWQGNPENPNNKQRSIPLEYFKILAEQKNIQIIPLQVEYDTVVSSPMLAELDCLNIGVRELYQKGIYTFDDTAAILNNIDLLVTCDTAVAHLAGAMGIDTCLVIAGIYDWRWGTSQVRSNWYPSIRIFRQEIQGDWAHPFNKINTYLSEKPGKKELKNDKNLLFESSINQLTNARHGVFLSLKNDIYIGNSLRRYGEFSELELKLLNQLVKNGDIVLDAGANIGTHAVVFSRLVGINGHVHCFEPQRLLYQHLSFNLALNCEDNVSAWNSGLANRVVTMQIPSLNPGLVNNFGGISLQENEKGECIELITIDSLKLDKCDFIKADVEGMEYALIEGARNTISAHRPVLYLEDDRKNMSDILYELLFGFGYRIFRHTPRLYNPDNFSGSPVNIFPDVASRNILCIYRTARISIHGLEEIR